MPFRAKICNKRRLWLSSWPLWPCYNRRPQGQPRDTATPRSLWNVAKAPKSKNLPLGSSAPGAVSRLSVGRFGPDFEPPAPWGQLEVFLPLTTQTCDPPPGPVLPLPVVLTALGFPRYGVINIRTVEDWDWRSQHFLGLIFMGFPFPFPQTFVSRGSLHLHYSTSKLLHEHGYASFSYDITGMVCVCVCVWEGGAFFWPWW